MYNNFQYPNFIKQFNIKQETKFNDININFNNIITINGTLNHNYDQFKYTNINNINNQQYINNNIKNNFIRYQNQNHIITNDNNISNTQINNHFNIQDNSNNNDNLKDIRTQDQVMDQISFSIDDLMNKINKVRQQYQQPNKNKGNINTNNNSKDIVQIQTNKFDKIVHASNLSTTSTQTNSQKSIKSHNNNNNNNNSNSNNNTNNSNNNNSQFKHNNYEYQQKINYHNDNNTQTKPQSLEYIPTSNILINIPKLQIQRQLIYQSDKNIQITHNNNNYQKQNSLFNKSQNLLNIKTFKNSFTVQNKNLINAQKQEDTHLQQPLTFLSNNKKVNSLFDSKNIRQVAASQIFESPQKIKIPQIIIKQTSNYPQTLPQQNNKKQSPFLDILQTSNNNNEKYQAQFLKDLKNKTKNIEQNNNFNKIIVKQQDQPQKQFKINIKQVNKAPTISKSNNNINNNEYQNFNNNLSLRDFTLGKQLGSGKFGDVYQAIHKSTGTLYAIKKIFKSTILQYNMVQQFTRQLKIHYSLNYPNIIKLYTHFEDEYHVFLVMQYAQGGMLMQKLKSGQKFSSIIIEQMLRAVDYLHSKKIAHRDIKPENIVMMFNDTAKLCDFGWSRVFDSDMKKTFCGTLDYVSPQMKDKGEYSLNIDIWSLGVLTFQLLCGYAPFKEQINSWKKKGGTMSTKWNWNIMYPLQISSISESFMRNLLKQNPNQRASIRFSLGHLFIKKYNQMNFDQEQNKRYKQIVSLLLRN